MPSWDIQHTQYEWVCLTPRIISSLKQLPACMVQCPTGMPSSQVKTIAAFKGSYPQYCSGQAAAEGGLIAWSDNLGDLAWAGRGTHLGLL